MNPKNLDEANLIISDITEVCHEQSKELSALRTLCAKLKDAGDQIAVHFNPGPIPAEEPTDADLAFGNWEYVSNLKAAAVADEHLKVEALCNELGRADCSSLEELARELHKTMTLAVNLGNEGRSHWYKQFIQERRRAVAAETKVKELEAWKESALSVMPDYQAISKVLDLPLGVDVPSRILPGIEKLKDLVHGLDLIQHGAAETIKKQSEELTTLKESCRCVAALIRGSAGLVTPRHVVFGVGSHIWEEIEALGKDKS